MNNLPLVRSGTFKSKAEETWAEETWAVNLTERYKKVGCAAGRAVGGS